MPADEGHHHDEDDSEDEDDYDLSPDEDEIDMDDLMDEDGESDDLDSLENPRVTEVDTDEEAPKLVESKKGKNKRAAESEASLEDLMAKDNKPAANGEEGLSKKQQKKQKKNNGEAAEAEQKKDGKENKEGKEGKKVQFAKNLEQGPTPSSQDKKTAETGTLGVKNVNGVTLDDKKLGKGAAAKAGNTVAMRYIGKLEDGKVFDGMLLSLRFLIPMVNH